PLVATRTPLDLRRERASARGTGLDRLHAGGIGVPPSGLTALAFVGCAPQMAVEAGAGGEAGSGAAPNPTLPAPAPHPPRWGPPRRRGLPGRGPDGRGGP